MNQGVAPSSPVQRMVDTGSRSWCCVDNMQPSLPPRNHLIFPHQLTPLILDDSHQDLPESWSQLLLEGLADEEGKPSLTDAKKLENWEQLQLLNQTLSNHGVDVKPEASSDGYTHDIRSRVEFQTATLPTGWSHHQMVSASSPISCITTSTTMIDNMVDFSPKSSDLRHRQEIPSPEYNGTASGGAAKKARLQPSSAQSTFKVRKEKLGDRITALHQLVSPFGKTDTASVLLEAIGYIRFLQTQIQALSLPYLGSGAGSAPIIHQNTESDEEPEKDLRSRGLCLVPISCTLHVGSEINGADYWASAFGANFR